MPPVSIVRLHVLRANYLLMFLAIPWLTCADMVYSPSLIAADDGFGFAACMLAVLSLLSALGLRHPLRMLPLLLFELGWKLIWLVRVALPLWYEGRIDDALRSNGLAVGSGLVLLAVIPWRYVLACYLRGPGAPWTTRAGTVSAAARA